MTERMTGVITPLLTPYNPDLSIATDLYLDHAAHCLAQGAHYLSPFGTTSEANSHSVAERLAMVELLISSGTARADQLMPGTGLCSMEETITLTHHAADMGCRAAMILPPFFYVDATDEGLYRYFSTLIDRVGHSDLRICLYHIPQFAGIGFSPALAARLSKAFPSIVIALKDSTGDWDNTRAEIEAAPNLSVFPGSESLMLPAMRLGGGGCISGSMNSNIAPIRAMYDLAVAGRFEEAEAMMDNINRHRLALQKVGLIPGLKSLKAHQTGDTRWLTLRPPLLDADPAVGEDLATTLG